MKKILLITFVAAYFCQGITAQNNAKIDVDLQQELTLRKASELIRINIILNQQYDQMDMRMKSSVFLKKEDKRAFVVSELKRFSKERQRGVMDFLSTEPTVSEVQSFWIANFINCYASIEAIEKLSLHPDVLLIGLDQEHQWIPEEKQSVGLLDETDEITYNVQKVNANQVWDELGYTGENIIVAVLDTGVNYNHVDLNDHMWVHPGFPYHGWNIYGNNNNPMDDNGHGTHCAGTVASDGTAGTHAGVAPKALIMAIKIWSSTGSGTVSNYCDGFQFAIDYGAHIISLSGGRANAANADKILLRNTAVSVLEAGIIAAVGAGNEGSSSVPPNSVRTPGSCPPPWLHPDQTTTGGISCVMSVGATDINDNIAGFSSRGPVTWQSISGYNDYPYNPGMGLIRPDVCAPGVNITSLDYANPTGYVSGWNGTSMATPCVAGVMALMLSKNINLTPAEICEILETTAVHLPNQSSPKGNTFGSGRIDAYAAVQAVVCSTINFTNQTVTSNTTVTGCNINVQNVTVQNGAKLTLDAANETIINSNFEVKLGSQLEIK
jgi:subtilisin family serine protease